jgi:aspartyl-tRNA(Asn)/glutamyl-tRNA(Gln) amidotransferase subunit A
MEEAEPHLNALLWRDADRSMACARAADRRLQAGERTPVLGLPFVLKDNFSLAGAPMTCGSRILDGYVPPHDATVVDRLLRAGAVPVAKANLDEFAMGSSGEYSAFGPARNPWDTGRVPGGSSSGSAVAVAAGYAPFALGSDTGGSVRLPAAFCNLTALRPTYGVLSRSGLAAMASSLDQPGPMARSAEDLALALSVMAGRDPLDATSVDLPGAERLLPLRRAELQGLRIGLPREYFGDGLDVAVRAAVEKALETLEGLGARLVEVSLPHTDLALDTYYLICTSEVSSNLSRYDGVRFGQRAGGEGFRDALEGTRDKGLGAEVKRRILLGAFCLGREWYEAYYLKALKARTLVAGDFARAFESVDVLATPTSPVLPFALGERATDPLAMHLADACGVAGPLASLPSLTMPAGFAPSPSAPERRLPVGIQLTGPALSDVRLLEIAHAFQSATDHHRQVPPFPA